MHCLIGDEAATALYDAQRLQAGRMALGNAASSCLYLRLFVTCEHEGSLRCHRSTSDSTKSMAPSIAIRSGIMWPRAMSGSICICGNDGVRMRQR